MALTKLESVFGAVVGPWSPCEELTSSLFFKISRQKTLWSQVNSGLSGTK